MQKRCFLSGACGCMLLFEVRKVERLKNELHKEQQIKCGWGERERERKRESKTKTKKKMKRKDARSEVFVRSDLSCFVLTFSGLGFGSRIALRCSPFFTSSLPRTNTFG